MKRLILILFVTPLFLFAYIHRDLVRIEAKLFSKIIFLDYDYRKKLVNGEVVVLILHDSSSHEEIAKKFAEELDGKKVFGKNIRVITDAEKIKHITPTAYLAVLEPENMKALLNKLISKKRLIFTSYEDQIDNAMVSVYLGNRIVPAINPILLKKSGIELRPIIFKVAKVYDNENQL